MKKVLALVLAVIMVCTMAFAIGVGGTGTTTAPTNFEGKFVSVAPGQSIYFTVQELSSATGLNVSVANAADAAKYKVAVKMASGADKIASQGWAKDENGAWVYALVTKYDETTVLDDAADIVIDSVVVSKVGTAITNTIEYVNTKGEYLTTDGTYAKLANADKTNKHVSAFDFGRATADLLTTANPLPTASTILYTVKKANAGDPASMKVAISGTSVGTNGNVIASYTLKVGEKVIFSDVPAFNLTTSLTSELQNEIITKDATVVEVLGNVVVPNKAIKITVDNQKEGYLYMVGADGKLTNLNAKFDDNKVLTATAKVTGPVVYSNVALTAVNVASTGSTGSTTNPGTGANDVVGVAAALAVVALVSGAAISLKK